MIDLTGKKFSLLTVLGISANRVRNVLSWDCICECGNTKVVAGADLRTGDTKSCGCMKWKGIKKDITGEKRGSLTAVSSTGVKCSNGDYKWNFICECGNTAILSIGAFNSKKYPCCKSCSRKRRAESNRTHGFGNTHKTYRAWCKIKDRCFNVESKDYPTYGARGIGMAQAFIDDFMNFYKEIGEAPKDGKRWSVDRIDHTKDYEPGNIRWATDCQQARNKGKSKANTSGVTGVLWDSKTDKFGKIHLYAAAIWSSYEIKNNRKCYSVKKLGLLPAFALACKYREDKIKELNALGFEYSENHGQ